MTAAGGPAAGGMCLVTDRSLAGSLPVRDVVLAAVAGGVELIQIREKDLPGRELLALTREIVEGVRTSGKRTRVVVNGRLDVALAAKAAGVHLPADGLPIREVRERGGKRLLIGRSVHSVQEARQAAKEGADYLFFGPVFETPSKLAYGPPQGAAALRKVTAAVRIPVWAIGGINLETLVELAGIPIAGVAVVSALMSSPDPLAAARALKDAVGASRTRSP
jgi:thiamine-phosphate pyrophosphorylase